MARDYQRKKDSKYILPRAVYHQTLWRIRDYYRLKSEADYLAEVSAVRTDTDRVTTSATGDPTGEAAERRERLMEDVRIIDKALGRVPNEYRRGIWESIMFGKAYPLDANRSTYGRHKSRFIYELAEDFGIY